MKYAGLKPALHEEEQNKTEKAGQAKSRSHARAAEDATDFGRDEAMVGDAQNGSERLAADYDETDVRYGGPLSPQEDFRRAASHAGIRHAQFRHFPIRSHAAGLGRTRVERPPHLSWKTLVFLRRRFHRGPARSAVVAQPGLRALEMKSAIV